MKPKYGLQAIRVAIISDTHGLLREEVKEILKTCSYIIHAGDVDRSSIIEELESLGVEHLFVVRGNNDGEWAESYPETLCISIGGIHFFIIHNKRNIPLPLPREEVIIFGHSHKYFCEEKEGKLWLNPGSCGRKRFYGAVTLAVMTIQQGHYKVEKIVLESEKKADIKTDVTKEVFSAANTVSIAEIKKVLTYMKKGSTIPVIAAELYLTEELVETICRIAVTHPGVSAEGIYNKMEVNHIYEK